MFSPLRFEPDIDGISMFLLPLKTQSAVAPPIFLRALIEGTRQFEVGPAAQLFQGKPARFSERTGSLILRETELCQQFDIGEDPVEPSVQIGNCLEDTNTFREWLGGFGGGRFRGTLSYAARAASAGDSHDLPPFSWRGRGRVDAFNSGALRFRAAGIRIEVLMLMSAVSLSSAV
jgi:hypothetical protein